MRRTLIPLLTDRDPFASTVMAGLDPMGANIRATASKSSSWPGGSRPPVTAQTFDRGRIKLEALGSWPYIAATCRYGWPGQARP